MTAEILKKNFSLLKTHHPNAYDALIGIHRSQDYEVSLSQSGHPTLVHIDSKGTKRYLLSKYDPLNEAERLVKSLNVSDHTNFIVFGMGLGYPTIELIKIIPDYSKIIVIEKDRELARLAFETTDFSRILLHSGLTFVFPNEIEEIATQLEAEKFNLCLNGYCFVQQNALSEVNKNKNNEIFSEVKNFIQASTIELKTQKAKSKIFYNNIAKNINNLISSAGINSLKLALSDVPAIICSAGPSLDKNIQFLKAKRNNFVLISVATALKTLLANKITPDFVIAIDPEEITLQFFELQNDPINTCLVYDPVIPPPIPDYFTGRRLVYDSSINLAEWFQKNIGGNGSLGKTFSVAHAAFQFAKVIGCSPQIFVGQDLSFEKHRLHSRDTYYLQKMEDQIGRNFTMNLLGQKNFLNYSNNIIEKESIFNDKLNTTVSLDTYAHIFSDSIESNSKTYNATEGGIGINQAINISLREAIYTYCNTNISTKINDTLSTLKPKPINLNQIKVAAQKQLALLKVISDQLKILEDIVLPVSVYSDRAKDDFVKKMKEMLKALLKDKETTLLLQGYNFSGFSIWNQRANHILNKKNLMAPKELLEEEFQRDYDFFDVLKDAVKFNIVVFDSFLRKANSN